MEKHEKNGKIKKIALLIDYDNFTQEKYFPVLFEELNEIGDIIIKYAFYSNLSDGTIKEKFIKYGIEPMSQIAYSKYKNAVDIRITIEAMSLLEKDYIDCICLASSDSDFTPLVKTLQKANKYVVGAGDNRATEDYKNSFNTFISVEKIIAPVEATKRIEDKKESKETEEIKALVKLVDNIIDTNLDEDGFADFSYVVLTLKKQMRDFNPKNYGSITNKTVQFFINDLKDYYVLACNDLVYKIKKKMDIPITKKMDKPFIKNKVIKKK
ncbi:MAG: NYN domain-containing protein [Bacilli bacterium]|nr:NYN domain-containing protein [Bacilli bacterium]